MAPKRTFSFASEKMRNNITKSGKLPVAEPTSVQKFAVILTMHLCRKTLLIETQTKLMVYMVMVGLGSFLTDLFPIPPSPLANKHHFVNWFFVKLGWGWTCFILMNFMLLTSYTYCIGKRELVRRHLSRLAVGTSWWYLCINIFSHVEHVTGFCTTDEIHFTKADCIASGGLWNAFDISGHAFLLTHSLLTISEEAKCLNGWERIQEVIKEEEGERPTGRLTVDQTLKLRNLYFKYTPYIRILVIVLTLMTVMWEIMLLATTIHFHNMPQKVTGCFFAALGWFLTYRIWYNHEWSPGQTGQGLVKYMKESS